MPRLISFFTSSFVILLLVLIIVGCKKEEAEIPSLTIVNALPAKLSFGDTLFLQFEASPVTRYRIAIMSGARVVSNQFLPVFQDGDFYEARLIFDDRYLDDGNYDIRLTAFNGESGTSLFHPFTFDGLDLAHTGIALLTSQKIIFEDAEGNIEREFPISGNFHRLKISPRDSLIYLASFEDHGIEIRHLRDFSLINQIVAPLGAGQRSFSDFVKTDQGIYLLERNGFIRYLEEGTVLQSAFYGRANRNDYYPQKGTILHNSLALVSSFSDGAQPQLHILNEQLFSQNAYALSGIRHQVSALGTDAVLIAHYNPGLMQWNFDRYRWTNQSYTSLSSINADSLYDFESIAPNEVLYSTDQGLYRQDLIPGATASPLSSGTFSNFQFRRTDAALFLQNGNLVQRFLLDNNLQFAAASNTTLLDYEILYNK